MKVRNKQTGIEGVVVFDDGEEVGIACNGYSWIGFVGDFNREWERA